MKKMLMAGAAMVAFIAPAAHADGILFADTLLIKTILVEEYISYDVDVTALATVNADVEKFAESIALANQTTAGNRACENCAEKSDELIGSGLGNVGIISINQASGNMNNSGTLISAAIDTDTGGGDDDDDGGDTGGSGKGFAEAKAGADQRNGLNVVNTVNILFRDAKIDGSLNGNTGLVYANQAAGNMTNQVNVLSLAFSLADEGVALAEADLGQFNVANSVTEGPTGPTAPGITKTASITGSLNGNQGIFGVNQSVGNMGNQANVVSIAAVGTGLPTF
jgi:hypothetical protein